MADAALHMKSPIEAAGNNNRQKTDRVNQTADVLQLVKNTVRRRT
jgi:hypothetical protein